MATDAGEADTVAAGDELPNPVVDGEFEQETNPDFLARDDLPPSKSVEVLFQIYHFLNLHSLQY